MGNTILPEQALREGYFISQWIGTLSNTNELWSVARTLDCDGIQHDHPPFLPGGGTEEGSMSCSQTLFSMKLGGSHSGERHGSMNFCNNADHSVLSCPGRNLQGMHFHQGSGSLLAATQDSGGLAIAFLEPGRAEGNISFREVWRSDPRKSIVMEFDDDGQYYRGQSPPNPSVWDETEGALWVKLFTG